jgi:tRNA(Ile2) C34 agmatinyltransferase TiaS
MLAPRTLLDPNCQHKMIEDGQGWRCEHCRGFMPRRETIDIKPRITFVDGPPKPKD